jgi:H-type small acid-soluble spore protein
MNRERINEILNHRNLSEVFYNEKPVWIQDVHDDIATIGFLDGSREKKVYIEDLYESNLYKK